MAGERRAKVWAAGIGCDSRQDEIPRKQRLRLRYFVRGCY